MEEFWRDPVKGQNKQIPHMIYQTEKKTESRKLEIFDDELDS